MVALAAPLLRLRPLRVRPRIDATFPSWHIENYSNSVLALFVGDHSSDSISIPQKGTGTNDNHITLRKAFANLCIVSGK